MRKWLVGKTKLGFKVLILILGLRVYFLTILGFSFSNFGVWVSAAQGSGGSSGRFSFTYLLLTMHIPLETAPPMSSAWALPDEALCQTRH